MSNRLAEVAILACMAVGCVVIAHGAETRASPRPPVPQPVASPPHNEDRITYLGAAPPALVLPDGRRAIIRSVLNVRAPMHYGDYVWNDAGVPEGPVFIRVDLGAQLISVFRAGHEIGSAVILFGADGKPTPVGDFTVLQKAKDYRSKSYDAPMPFMMRLTADGVAIHASNVREGWATHGCIGVPPDFAKRLFAQVALGDPVVIVPVKANGAGA
jgi:hypothetical protein